MAVVDVEELAKKQGLKPNLQLFAEEGFGEVCKYSSDLKKAKKVTSLDYKNKIIQKNGKYYANKSIIDEIGKIESKGENFSLLHKK